MYPAYFMHVDKHKPLLMFHGNSSVYGKPNSAKTVKRVMKYNPDIIELDLRSSRDGILYCHHGASPFVFLLKYLPFSAIRKLLNVDTLKNILNEIDQRPIIFLDIKETNIPAHRIDALCHNRKNKIWLASSTSVTYLSKLKHALENKYLYMYNFSFLFFQNGFTKAKQSGINCFKISKWQCTGKNIRQIREAGLQFTIHPLLIKEKEYKKLVSKFGSLWVAVDDMEKPDMWLVKI